ncbi:MAG TPA: hypothetical protein VMI11_07710 [Actinomycetes bacterium]|nr:hypothetical protein [Actinomycetes bacterium]
MPVSRGRKRKPDRSRGPGHRRSDPRKVPRLLMRSLADPGLNSPLHAEVELSYALGAAYRVSEAGHRADIEEQLARQLLEEAQVSTSPGARELLAVLASIGPDAVAAEAMQALTSADQDDSSQRSWLADVGRWECTEALHMSDEDGDVEEWAAFFALPDGTERHGMVWLVDMTASTWAADAFLVVGHDEVVAHMREDAEREGLSLEPVDPGLLHRMVRDAMRLTDMSDPAPESETYSEFHALARGRLRCLPPPAELPEPLDEQGREALVADFVASTYGQGLLSPADGEEAPEEDSVRFLARLLVDHAVDVTGGEPLRVTPATVETFMLDWVPRKVLLEPDDAGRLPEVTRAWVRYAYAVTGRPDERREATLAAVTTYTPEFGRMVASGEGRGLGAQLLAGFMDQGVDITDPDALAAAVERYNASLGDR